MISKFINSFSDINLLNNINGLPINIIENRAKAIQDNTTDKESWRYRSFDGFLGENETFKSRLEIDWSLLESYNKENNTNINHLTLSSILKEILIQCEKIRKDLNYGPMAPIKLIIKKKELYKKLKKNNKNLDFKFLKIIENTHNNNNNNNNEEELIEFNINKNIFNGYQYSLFWNEDQVQDSKLNWNTKWNIEYHVINVKTQKEIIISGDHQSGIIQYIEYLGFYEGDENNQYRINPIKLIQLFLNK